MINSKYRYYFLATGFCTFLLMQFTIYFKYQDVYGKNGAPFSFFNYIASVNVLALFLSAVSCLFLWLSLKTPADDRAAVTAR